MNIKENPKEILNAIAKEHGIEYIKKFLNTYNKAQRKKQKKINSYDEIAKEVYNLVLNNDYSKTRAMDEIADRRNIKAYTVRNHCSKFDKEIREFDFYSFGVLVNEQRAFHGVSLKDLSRINNIDYDLAEIFYYKYKTAKKKPDDKEIDTSKFRSYFDDNLPF